MAWAGTASRAPKVGVCVPIKTHSSIEWAFQFAQMCQVAGAGAELALYESKHYELDYARNDLVDKALADKCTHVFFLDSDVIPWWYEAVQRPDGTIGVGSRPFPEVIPQFLSLEYPIVSGLYWVKRPPGGSNLAEIVDNELFIARELKWDFPNMLGHRILVDLVAMGCVLIDTRVFERIPYPWFSYYRTKERGPDGHFRELSEDFYFGRKATAAGFRTMALGNVICKHEGRVFISWGGEANGVLMA